MGGMEGLYALYEYEDATAMSKVMQEMKSAEAKGARVTKNAAFQKYLQKAMQAKRE